MPCGCGCGWVTGLACAAALLVAVAPVQGLSAPAGGGAVFLVGGLRYRVGGEFRLMDAAPFVDAGRVFVPVRYLAYALGVPEDGVLWDPLTGPSRCPPEGYG